MSRSPPGRHPFSWLPAARRPRALALALAGTLALGILLGLQGRPLNQPGLPRAILSYELAFSAERAQEIKTAWRDELDTARTQIRLDFAFLLFYPVFLSLACALLAERGAASWLARTTGFALSWAVLPSGLLDAIENAALLRMLSATPTDTAARLAGVCATLKFGLVFAALGYLTLQGVVALFARASASRPARQRGLGGPSQRVP